MPRSALKTPESLKASRARALVGNDLRLKLFELLPAFTEQRQDRLDDGLQARAGMHEYTRCELR